MLRNLAFDFSTLPKVVTHAQLGRLGKLGECAWYSPQDCYTPEYIQAAKNELEQSHPIVIDFATATKTFYDDAVAQGAPSEVINALYSSYQNGLQLVRDHTAIMNDFYSKTGVGVSGLSGMGTLSQAQLLALAPLLGMALRQIVWLVLGYFVGKAADTFVQNAKANQEKFKAQGEYYIAWRTAKEHGESPPAPPDDLEDGGLTGNIGSILAIVGIVMFGLLFMKGR